MDRIFSARLNEAAIQKVGTLARKLRTTKKAVLEAAIDAYSEQVNPDQFAEILKETCGAMKRKESPAATVARIRKETEKSMTRYHR